MSAPEKKPKDDGKPELGAILPDVFADLDDYQKKIENDWETTKSAYKEKINDILEDFIAQNPTPGAPPPKSAPSKPAPAMNDPVASVEERMERLLSRVEHSLRATEERPRLFSGWRSERPSIINIPWDGYERFRRAKKVSIAAVAVVLLAAGAYFQFVRIPNTTPLPYIHPSTIAFVDNKVYIVEWFRKALYTHNFNRSLPILQVENIPNNFLAGVAFSDKYLWTLDAFSHQILQHSLASDHRVLKTFATPGQKPAGLFWDGTDIWSADLDDKKIYRNFGADPETVRTAYGFSDFSPSSLYFKENRLWILDAKSRMVYQCRLEDPLRVVGRYDLDPVLKGAAPTDFTMRDGDLWILAENPPQLLRLSPSRLKKLSVN